MSLNTVTDPVTDQVNKNPVRNSQPKKLAQNADKQPRKLGQATSKAAGQTTKQVTDTALPGQFPGDESSYDTKDVKPADPNAPSAWESFKQWTSSKCIEGLDKFEDVVKWLINRYFPEGKQAEMYEEAMKRPASTTFLVCQAICCGIPLLVFLAGVCVFGAVALLLWAILSLLILGPVLLVASCMGVAMWGWGWIFYSVLKWVDKRYLGGIISRWFLPKIKPKEEEGKSGEDEGGVKADGQASGKKDG